MNDGIGKVPPSPGDKPMEPIKPADDHKPKPIEPATKNVLGMQMTKKQAEQFNAQLWHTASTNFNSYAKRALEAIKRLGRKSRGEE